jgi:hypothetical protein
MFHRYDVRDSFAKKFTSSRDDKATMETPSTAAFLGLASCSSPASPERDIEDGYSAAFGTGAGARMPPREKIASISVWL